MPVLDLGDWQHDALTEQGADQVLAVMLCRICFHELPFLTLRKPSKPTILRSTIRDFDTVAAISPSHA